MDQSPPLTNGAGSDDEIHLRDVYNLLLRNWWVIALSLVATVGATVAYTVYQVPVFESVTSIRIAEERSELPVLDVIQDLSSGSEVETEMEVLRSRTLAEEVVDSLSLQVTVAEPRGVARTILLDGIFVERWAPEGIYLLERQADGDYVITEEESGMDLGIVSTQEAAALPGATFRLTEAATEYPTIVVGVAQFERAVSRLQEGVAVARPNREAAIITVRYESADTQLVHRVPNTLANRFIDRGQAIRKTEATSTVSFLEEQIDTLSRQLATAEEALTTFRETEQVVSITAEAESQVTQLARLQAERNTIEAERQALQQLVNEIEEEAATADPAAPSPYTKLISFPPLLRNQAISELLRTLNQANAERSELLRRRTMQDPDVQSLTQRIQDIETQLRETALTYLQVVGVDRRPVAPAQRVVRQEHGERATGVERGNLGDEVGQRAGLAEVGVYRVQAGRATGGIVRLGENPDRDLQLRDPQANRWPPVVAATQAASTAHQSLLNEIYIDFLRKLVDRGEILRVAGMPPADLVKGPAHWGTVAGTRPGRRGGKLLVVGVAP